MEASRRLRTYAVEDDRSEEAGDEVAPEMKDAGWKITAALEDINSVLEIAAKENGTDVPEMDSPESAMGANQLIPALRNAHLRFEGLIEAFEDTTMRENRIDEIIEKASSLARLLRDISEQCKASFPKTSKFFGAVSSAINFIDSVTKLDAKFIGEVISTGLKILSSAVEALMKAFSSSGKVSQEAVREGIRSTNYEEPAWEEDLEWDDFDLASVQRPFRRLSAIDPRLSYVRFGHSLLPAIKEKNADGLGVCFFVLPIGALFIYLLKTLRNGSKCLQPSRSQRS